MNVKNLKLINFRNYQTICLNLNENINIFIGKNAQGKTNLIEAIYMCSKGNSFRTSKDGEIINFDKDEAYIGCNVDINNYNRLIEIKLSKNEKKIIRINKTPVKTQKELNSGLNIVVFSPDDLKIVKEGPGFRREFIDNSIAQIKPVYNYNLGKYNKILYQRNNILKSNRFKNNVDISSLLEAFDMQMVKIGTTIILERKRFIESINEISNKIHFKISSGKEDLKLEYDTNVPFKESRREIEDIYFDLLKDSLKRDLEYGNTQIGPHRDDMNILLNNNSARTFGSQGQQRSCVLSLKIGEVELIKDNIGSYPVLLLDDVYSELDMDRRKYLTSLFGKMQTFITLSNSESLDSIKHGSKSIFYIEDGNIKNRRKRY